MAAGHPPVGLEGTSPPRAPEPGGTGADPRGVGPDDAFPSFGARRDHGARAPSGGSSRRAPTTNSHKRSEEARRFAASAAAMQRELVRELRRGEMRSARVPKKAPPDASGPGYLETFPRGAVSGESKPTLLRDLERMLRDKLRLARRAAGVDDERGDDARSRDDRSADDPDAYASLDAHRQTFDAFVDAFTTYKPLLSEIKRRYDRALDGALRSERACAGLRAEVAAAERRRLAEVRDARAETVTKAANVRGDALRRAAAAEAKAAAAEARAAAAEAETARWRAHAEAADLKTAEAEERSAVLRRRAEAETSWAEARGDAAERLLRSEMVPVPRDFAREDAELVDGEGGLNREQKGGEPPPPGEGHGEEKVGGAEGAHAPEVQPEQPLKR